MADYRVPGRQYAQDAGLSWDIVDRLITQESRWNHYTQSGQILTSPMGALGLTQLMPATAKELGVDAKDPLQNLKGGITYLRKMLDYFNGDMVYAVAAYNMGPGNAEQWDRTRSWLHNTKGRNGGYPFRETEKYLDSILGTAWPMYAPSPNPPVPGGGTVTPPIYGAPPSEGWLSGLGGNLASLSNAVLRDPLIDKYAPGVMAVIGIAFVGWGLTGAVMSSGPGRAAINVATTVVPQARVARAAMAGRMATSA